MMATCRGKQVAELLMS